MNIAETGTKTDGSPLPDLEDRQVFDLCMHAVTRNLIVEFNGEKYEQKKGLAMGLHCSPDIANLFGAEAENSTVPSMIEEGNLLFYGRYIDDIFCIVSGFDNASAAIHYVNSRIEFTDCTIEWEASREHCVFLDLMIWTDSFGVLQHKPYRKMLNHHERLPWASAHPKHVKRGCYLGEMSRLATLSSHFKYYRDALESLEAIYWSRGYPQRLINSWQNKNMLTRWNNRLGIPVKEGQDRERVLVLKSKYNPVWQWFDTRAFRQCIFDAWLLHYDNVKWCRYADDGRLIGAFESLGISDVIGRKRLRAFTAEFVTEEREHLSGGSVSSYIQILEDGQGEEHRTYVPAPPAPVDSISQWRRKEKVQRTLADFWVRPTAEVQTAAQNDDASSSRPTPSGAQYRTVDPSTLHFSSEDEGDEGQRPSYPETGAVGPAKGKGRQEVVDDSDRDNESDDSLFDTAGNLLSSQREASALNETIIVESSEQQPLVSTSVTTGLSGLTHGFGGLSLAWKPTESTIGWVQYEEFDLLSSEINNARFVVSSRRTKNFGDVTRAWNRALLDAISLERAEESFDPPNPSETWDTFPDVV